MATDFRILGPLEVVDNGVTIDLGGQKQRALLAMLLLHANEVVSTDRLIDALWEDDPPARAQKALQVYVSGLRKVVGPGRIETKAPGYLVRAGAEELDAARFEALVAQGAFRDALALWRGPALGDFAYARFAATEIARLEELRLSALEARIEQNLAEGRHAEVAGELEGLVREHPLRERLRGQLMLALYRAGRQANALEAYQDARRALSDELGLEPSRELRELQQAILRHDPVLDDAVATAGGAEPPRGIFVGREQELSELLAGLADALAGGGRLFLLRGEPGIGKSRLAEEVIAQARARGAQVLVGRCWEAGGAPAYWPWVQALRAYIECTTPDALRSELGAHGAYLTQLLPELRELLPELSEPPALESESARFRLFEAALLFLRRAAAARPVVLVLDDLHAADQPSLLFLQFVARELAESRILIIGAYRDVDPTLAEPLTTALVELGREPTTRTIALTGLDESDVERFIELTANDVAAVELAVAVHAETEGNPLFVGEIVRLLAAEGKLGDISELAIPQSVRDVIGRRLRHLSDESNRVLVLASVLGREFDLNALSGVAAVSEDELLETLDEAMTARVVSDVPDSPRRSASHTCSSATRSTRGSRRRAACGCTGSPSRRWRGCTR
jgi:DNA-binding SARP family transcriptional activator